MELPQLGPGLVPQDEPAYENNARGCGYPPRPATAAAPLRAASTPLLAGCSVAAPPAAPRRPQNDFDPAGLSRRFGQLITMRSGRARWEGKAAPRHVRGRPPKPRCSQRVSLWAVDRWPLATIRTNQLGASPGRYPPQGVTGRRASSSLGSHVPVREGLAAGARLGRKVPWGTQWGQLDGLAGPRLFAQASRRVPLGVGRAARGRAPS